MRLEADDRQVANAESTIASVSPGPDGAIPRERQGVPPSDHEVHDIDARRHLRLNLRFRAFLRVHLDVLERRDAERAVALASGESAAVREQGERNGSSCARRDDVRQSRNGLERVWRDRVEVSLPQLP